MKKVFFAGALCLWVSSSRAAAPVVLLSAYATSRSADSTDVLCLIDPACKGHWAPGAKDSGVNEGLYYQFENPVHVSYIRIYLKNLTPRGSLAPLRFYIDGKTTSPNREKYFIDMDTNQTNVLRIGVGNSQSMGPIDTSMRSFFLCIDKGHGAHGVRTEIERIEFLSANEASDPLVIQRPTAAFATVTATSILTPESAYQPAHLFDSRTDLAWATDGSKTTGVNESFTVNFKEEQSIKGLILWNGYERSSTHYQANGRVRKAEISTDDNTPEMIELKDLDGPQDISLSHERKAKKITFTIKEIYPGSKYKDVLLSELHFVQSSGQFVIPAVTLQMTPLPAAWLNFMDRSWTSILASVGIPGPDDCGGKLFNNRLRLRSDGTFIAYLGQTMNSNDNRVSAQVLEGNWEPKGDDIRIFGKKYSTDIVTSDYLTETHAAPPAIFQSVMTLKRYQTMTPAEKKEILSTVTHSVDAPEVWPIDVSKEDKENEIRAKGLNAYIAQADRILMIANPYFVRSSVFSALLLPTDDISDSVAGCD